MIKKLYPQRRIDQLWKLRFPFLSEVKKDDAFEGSSIETPVEHDRSARSRTFSNAQANRSPTSSVNFSVTRVKDYAVARIDAETMHSTRSNMGGFVRVMDREIENMLLTLQQSTAHGLYRNKGGAIGVISAIADGLATNDKVTLIDNTDIINFHIGQTLNAASTDGTSGAIRVGDTEVAYVDFDGGFFYNTGTDLTSDITNVAVADYLFNEGDFGVSISGLAGWIPATVTSTSFFGVDRTVDKMRLAGHRVSDTSLSIEEAIQELCAKISFSGGRPDRCYVNPMKLKELVLEMGGRVSRDAGGHATGGFRGVSIDTPSGSIEVLGDPACPLNLGYVLELSSWELTTLQALPHLVMDDGQRTTRVTDADQLEVRGRLWCNLRCFAPGHNGMFTMA